MPHRLCSPQAEEQCESMGGKFINERLFYYYCQPPAHCPGSCKTQSLEKISCGGPLELISRSCTPNQKKLDKLLCDEVYKGDFKEGTFDSALLIGEDLTPFWVCQRPSTCKAECEYKWSETNQELAWMPDDFCRQWLESAMRRYRFCKLFLWNIMPNNPIDAMPKTIETI